MKIRNLCEKDGGVVVLERVHLTHEEFVKNDGNEKYGRIDIRSERTTKPSHDYYTKNITTILTESGSLDAYHSVYTTYRKSDWKVMQRATFYSRRGGDTLPLDNPSYFGCQQIPEVKKRYEEKFYTY